MGLKSFFRELYDFKSVNIGANDVIPYFSNRGVLSSTNSNKAIQHATVYACIRDKAESIGQLPVRLYRKQKDGTKEEVKQGREHRIFTKRPNDFMTMQDFKEMYETCMEINGNFFAYVVRNDRGSISEVIPFRFQTNVSVNMDMHGNVYFIYTTNDGKPNMTFNDEEIMHTKLNTSDGFTGLSPIKCAARTIGLGIAEEIHMEKLLELGAMPSGVLETDKIFKDENRAERIRQQFKEKYQGVAKTGEVIFLEGGLKFNPLTISPADSQLLESMRYNREQICGIFRVPPRRVGASGTKDSADVEQENKDYYINALMPLVTKFEDAWNAIIPDNMEFKLDETGFVRGDLESQVKAFGELFKLTAISIDELRSSVGYQPVENGHLHAIDTNNITLGELKDIKKIQEQNKPVGSNSNET